MGSFVVYVDHLAPEGPDADGLSAPREAQVQRPLPQRIALDEVQVALLRPKQELVGAVALRPATSLRLCCA